MIKFNVLSRRVNIEVHVIHISCVIFIYTLESLSSLTDNMEFTGYYLLNKNGNKKKTKKKGGHSLSWLVIGITTQQEESKEK